MPTARMAGGMAQKFAGLNENLLIALASAALLGGGATVVANMIGIAVLNERVTRLEELNGSVEELQDELKKTREELLRGRATGATE